MGITVVLHKLAQLNSGLARQLYMRLMLSWGVRPDRQRVTVKLGIRDMRLLKKLRLPRGTLDLGVLPSKGWIATYQHPNNPHLEVTVRSKSKPPTKRIFNIGGKKRRLTAVEVTHLTAGSNNKEAVRMATRTKKGTSRKKAVEEEDLDELEGLEDLEDLEDLDDEDVDEPDDEEDEDDEEEEEPAPRRRGRAKKPAAKKSTRSRRKVVEEEDEEDEDEEDEDEEEEAPRRKRTTAKKSTAKKSTAASKTTAKKSTAKKDGKSSLPTTRELPKGQVGPEQIAQMVGGNCDARYVRIWLRESDYEREEGTRWSFTKGDARDIAREIKRDRKEAGAK